MKIIMAYIISLLFLIISILFLIKSIYDLIFVTLKYAGKLDFFDKKSSKIPYGWRRLRLGEKIPKRYYFLRDYPENKIKWFTSSYYSGDRYENWVRSDKMIIKKPLNLKKKLIKFLLFFC